MVGNTTCGSIASSLCCSLFCVGGSGVGKAVATIASCAAANRADGHIVEISKSYSVVELSSTREQCSNPVCPQDSPGQETRESYAF